jgi:hypothetical protein
LPFHPSPAASTKATPALAMSFRNGTRRPVFRCPASRADVKRSARYVWSDISNYHRPWASCCRYCAIGRGTSRIPIHPGLAARLSERERVEFIGLTKDTSRNVKCVLANGASRESSDIDHTTRGARVREREAIESSLSEFRHDPILHPCRMRSPDQSHWRLRKFARARNYLDTIRRNSGQFGPRDIEGLSTGSSV